MTAQANSSAMQQIRHIIGLLLLAPGFLAAQQSPAPAAPAAAQSPIAAPPGLAPDVEEKKGTVIDGVVAVVNGDVILESDVDEERRFETIQPYRGSATEFARDRAVQRLIDRTLILQQAALEPDQTAVTNDELNGQLQTLRKDIPRCGEYHCQTDDGWTKFLADSGFTVKEFNDRWRQRMELLKLIEVRFRNGIRISSDQIKDYYEKVMLPEYARQKVNPPQLDGVSARIEEVLLQQQVGALLRDWLKSLRAQGNVWVTKPGEVAP